MEDTELDRTVFAAQLQTIEPTDDDLQEAKASLGMLHSLLPPGVDPADEPDLLFIVANVAVAGLVNLNDDGLTIATALARYKKFEKKFVDIEHDRKKARGFILHAGLSEFGTDRVISEDEARAANRPFNISTVAVLWKSVDKYLCAYLLANANPASPEYKTLSLSFEMGFPKQGYSVATLPDGEREIAKATRMIGPTDDDFAKYSTALRANKGTGISPDNAKERVYRIMPDTVVPLGEGIVSVPAAAVKGIDVIDAVPGDAAPVVVPESAADMGDSTDDSDDSDAAIAVTQAANLALIAATKASLSTLCDKLAKNRVSPLTTLVPTPLPSHPMNSADIKKVTDQAAAATKLEELQVAFASAAHIIEALNTESERRAQEVETQKGLAAEVAKAKETAEAQAKLAGEAQAKVTAELETVKKQLTEIQAAQALAAAEEEFNSRMTTLDEEFELGKEERALLIDEVRAAPNAEAFAKFMAKQKVLMKDKTKTAKAAKKAADKTKSDELCAALAAKGVKVTPGDNIDFAEILASAVRTDGTLPNAVTAGDTLLDKAKAAFSDFTIGGREAGKITAKE